MVLKMGAHEKGEKKKKRQKKKSSEDDGYLSDDKPQNALYSAKNCAARLSVKTVREGMTVLGRVSLLLDTKVMMNLPGNLHGTVMACHISEPYNKILESYVNDQTEKIKEIPDMFRPGQYVAVKVLEVEGKKLMLSMMPQHVNSDWIHTDLVKGDILQAAVSSEEDHGYVMDIGIPNTRAFLPKKKANPEIALDSGMVTWCCVRSVDSSATSSIVTLSSELPALRDAAPRRTAPKTLLPATKLNFIVDTPLENGIEGHVLDGTTAYIQRQHLDKVKGKKPAIGQKIQARVMYATQPRNTPFLTMRDIFATTYPDVNEEQKIKDGEIINDAQVVRVIGRSIHFRLASGCIGSLSLWHLQSSEDLDEQELITKSYPIGSKHAVRVVSYSPCEHQYLVSDQPAVLAQRYFSLRQLAPGDLVSGLVVAVTDTNILVELDQLKGFVHQSHLTDAGVVPSTGKHGSKRQLTRKFRVGQEVTARVLDVDPDKQKLILTMKPSFLAEDVEVLKSPDDAKIGKTYTGYIRVVRDYIMVSFFNNVLAYVPRKYVSREPIENLSEAFHVGQIVSCTIIYIDFETKKLSGSLIQTQQKPQPQHEHSNKRKMSDDTDEVHNKKVKHDGEAVISKKKKDLDVNEAEENTDSKKKGNKKQKSSESNPQDDAHSEELDKKKKKRKETVEEENSKSEESDAIETDIYEDEDSDQILTAKDEYLIDLSSIVDTEKCRKRVISLIKNVNCRLRRVDRIDEKILKIETKGLNSKNKKFHTAMHKEKLVVQERAQKLLEALKKAQEKLVELGYDPETDPRHLRRKKRMEMKANKANGVVNGKLDEIESCEDGQMDTEDVKVEKKKRKKEKKQTNEPDIDMKELKDLEPVLDVPSAKDFWTANTDSSLNNVKDESSSSSDEEQTEKPKKKRKKLSVAEKQAKAREEEARVREMEQRAIASASQPRSTEHFERALLAEPNCSQLWIAYMAFHLQSTEVEKARAAGRRALAAISFREEAERRNVWLALLNCEARFGTQESLLKVLEEALQMNDPFTVHSKLLDMYVETGKQQEAISLVDLMVRKYRRLAKAYTHCGAACFRLGLIEKARNVMQKAIAVLDKKEHVSVLVRFAGLERAHGQRERCEALFEHVLAACPRRVDVAAAYADVLRGAGDLPQLRQVMERLTSQKLPARKMKVLYKKWIEIEEKIGDSEKIEEIRQRAMEYIEQAKF
ncbi:hypothetical protein ACJJTC_001108 [Scirpophaga incertulas]